ncbi:MAG: AI-2E family transporter [Gemmatimonadaceae bacterium]
MRLTSSIQAPRPERPLGSTDLVRAALIVVATLVALQLLWAARFLVLTAFLGILLGLSAARAVDWICARAQIRRQIVAAGVVFGIVGLFVVFVVWSGPALVEQSHELRTKLPEALVKIENALVASQPQLLDMIAPADSAGGSRLVAMVSKNAPQLTDFAFGVLQSTVLVAAAVVLVIFLALYVAADPGVYRRGALLLVPLERRDRVAELLAKLGTVLRTWFATQLIAMLVIGAVTTLVLLLLDVRAALPLGVLAGLFEFIPNIGPLLAGVPAVLMGFVDSPEKALTVAAVYWGIQFLENNLLIPYLMSEQLDLPPALTLITQVVMAYVFGFLGLFVAIPLLATAVVAVRTLWVDDELPPLPTVEMPVPGGKEL